MLDFFSFFAACKALSCPTTPTTWHHVWVCDCVCVRVYMTFTVLFEESKIVWPKLEATWCFGYKFVVMVFYRFKKIYNGKPVKSPILRWYCNRSVLKTQTSNIWLTDSDLKHKRKVSWPKKKTIITFNVFFHIFKQRSILFYLL